jgi:hypothetical protein
MTTARVEQREWSRPKGTDQQAEQPGTAPPGDSQDNRSYYQLYLIGAQSSLKTPPNSKKVPLEHAASRAAADLLHLIYPSIGPSGAEDQRFLVYQDEPTWAAASEFAPLLDAPEITEAPPVDPSDPVTAMKTGVGLLYRLNQPGQQTDFAGYRRVRRLMETAVNSAQASGQLRWGAAILAGRVSTERLHLFAEARKYYELAQGHALPGSVEEMIAAFLIADAYRRDNQRQQATQLARALVRKFVAHRASYLYEQAAEMAVAR